eukprot:COSAG05_NODE_1239_length_5425_cov_3.841532_3_plen_49_part_00
MHSVGTQTLSLDFEVVPVEWRSDEVTVGERPVSCEVRDIFSSETGEKV